MAANEYASVHPARRLLADEELLRLLLMGFTLREIAEQTKINLQTVRRRAKEPQFLLKVKEHSGEIAKRLVDELATSQVEFAQRMEQASEEALDEMMALMHESSGTLKFKIAQDLLDRDSRSSKTKRLDLSGTMSHSFINPALLIHAAATAKEIEKKELPNGDDIGHPSDSSRG